jgi:fructose-1,6-bisphosphatase/inositol monophosphatase family enzyme
MTNRLLDIDVLIQAARNAGDTAQRWRQEQLGRYGKVTSTRKPDGSVVTEADRVAQDIIERILLKMDPQAMFIGEEGAAGKLKLSAFAQGTRCFLVDPIDGTSSYVRGGSGWSVSIAYARIEEPSIGEKTLETLAAVVYAPGSSERALYFASETGPAILELNGKRDEFHAAGTDAPVMTFYCKGIPGDTDQTRRTCEAMKQLAENPAKYRQDTAKGSPALSLAAAARHRNIVVTREDHPFQPVTAGAVAPWDSLAGRFIYQSAGGKFASSADRYGNVTVGPENLVLSVMGPAQVLADEALAALIGAVADTSR